MKNTNNLLNIILHYVPLVILLLFLLFPFYWTFVTSIKSEKELYSSVITYWPRNITFISYQKLFVNFNFIKPIINSFIVALSTTIISILVSTLAAYAFSRYNFRGKKCL
ncbi:ABC transporter permease family protein [Thermoanaerobacter thermocopriae]|nr:hypothetical protein [Thermoanaerobacter thermocopriae]